MTAANATQTASPLARRVTTLWGVGPERATQLARLDIVTIEDLLLHRPRRYEDRRQFRRIADLQLHEPALTRGQVVALGVKTFRRGQKSLFELILSDGSARLHCRWWNLPFMEKYFHVGNEVVVYGKLLSIKPRTIDHPETEVLETGDENLIHLNRIAPVYPLTEGLPQRWLRALIWRTLSAFESKITNGWSKCSSPDTWHLAPGTPLPTRAQAVHRLHFPETLEDIELARQRLALDEYMDLQFQIQRRRKQFEAHARALPCGGDNRLIKPFLARLGFKLTEAQTGVLREIRAGLRGAHPMRRLLQGDVGSGKTVVAACTALMTLESGYQAALMAPTEILAEQHFETFTRWFEPLGIQTRLLTATHKTVENPRPGAEAGKNPAFSTLDTPASNSVGTFFIGTHALIASSFSPDKLGLVIIDEQHKFGVAQRQQLVRKGRYPHLLVMTATPIPRTLGLTLYGDLDISVIHTPPPGRGQIKTVVRSGENLAKVWSFLRAQLAQGRQAYVVYPRVEETGEGASKAVTREFEALRRLFAPHRSGLLHGRMSGAQRGETMAAFRANQLQVLVATSLIEVGLDIPNATVMVIENAEQFGLAQLHQLRGRIGRGAQNSYCILVSSAKRPEARNRLKILEQTIDGFQIAAADLKLRGPGELLGPEQSGIPPLRFGDLGTDWELIELARENVKRLLSSS